MRSPALKSQLASRKVAFSIAFVSKQFPVTLLGFKARFVEVLSSFPPPPVFHRNLLLFFCQRTNCFPLYHWSCSLLCSLCTRSFQRLEDWIRPFENSPPYTIFRASRLTCFLASQSWHQLTSTLMDAFPLLLGLCEWAVGKRSWLQLLKP